MKVQFMRVAGPGSFKPGVLANADGYRVRWNYRPGWRCQCPASTKSNRRCEHVDAVDSLLAPFVTTAHHINQLTKANS